MVPAKWRLQWPCCGVFALVSATRLGHTYLGPVRTEVDVSQPSGEDRRSNLWGLLLSPLRGPHSLVGIPGHVLAQHRHRAGPLRGWRFLSGHGEQTTASWPGALGAPWGQTSRRSLHEVSAPCVRWGSWHARTAPLAEGCTLLCPTSAQRRAGLMGSLYGFGRSLRRPLGEQLQPSRASRRLHVGHSAA